MIAEAVFSHVLSHSREDSTCWLACDALSVYWVVTHCNSKANPRISLLRPGEQVLPHYHIILRFLCYG